MDVRDERSEADDAAFAAEEAARAAAQVGAREGGAPALELEVGEELDLDVTKGDGAAPADPGAVQPGEQSAAEGLAEQMEKASGTVYVLFAHGVMVAAGSQEDAPKRHDAITVKALGGEEAKLEAMMPIGFGRYTGAPAALLACREKFGEGEYAAIPLRNITVKAWKREQVAKWV
jgi:hypothetical protein